MSLDVVVRDGEVLAVAEGEELAVLRGERGEGRLDRAGIELRGLVAAGAPPAGSLRQLAQGGEVALAGAGVAAVDLLAGQGEEPGTGRGLVPVALRGAAGRRVGSCS